MFQLIEPPVSRDPSCTLHQHSGMNFLIISEMLIVLKFLRNCMYIVTLVDNLFIYSLILSSYMHLSICFCHCSHLSVFIFTLLYIHFYLFLALISMFLLLCFIFYPLCTYSSAQPYCKLDIFFQICETVEIRKKSTTTKYN